VAQITYTHVSKCRNDKIFKSYPKPTNEHPSKNPRRAGATKCKELIITILHKMLSKIAEKIHLQGYQNLDTSTREVWEGSYSYPTRKYTGHILLMNKAVKIVSKMLGNRNTVARVYCRNIRMISLGNLPMKFITLMNTWKERYFRLTMGKAHKI
jgi:hypothetical protein